MNNMQPYLDLSSAAKEAGGVDRLLDAVAAEAVWKAAPKIVVASLLVGGGVVAVGYSLRDRYIIARKRAAMQREALRKDETL